MFRLHFVPYGTKVDFVKKSKIILPLSVILMLFCAVSIFFKGLNYGIDFKGGYTFEVTMPQTPDIPKLREDLGKLTLGEVSIQQFGSESDLLIKLEKPEEGSSQAAAIQKVKDTLGENVTYKRVETVGPKVGAELVSNAIKAVAFALLAMLVYIVIRFEWQFAVCAIVALIHDCAIMFGLFSIFPLEFSETSITAVLLTASYSINDTVVIFDRVRENMKRYRKSTLREIVNRSINETLSRTTLTATTTLLAVLALYLFGGSVISTFALPILIGIVLGTASTIFVATPLLVYLNIKVDKNDKGANKTVANKDGAIV